jgi:ribosomal protein S18 acetylase RimI-like enzyme
MKLVPIESADFDAIYAKMEAAFIREERRDPAPARALLENPLYRVYHLAENGERVGFVTIWMLEGVTFIEHLAIDEQYRNRGFGAAALEVLKARFSQLVLEVEQPVTEMAARRIGFYERNGFYQNDYPYRQPSYREPGEEIDMILMTYPAPLEEPASVVAELYHRVYGVL